MKKLSIILVCFFQFALSQKVMKHEVYFETDKYDIPQTENNRLLLFLSQVDTLDIERIEIYGFTDDRGSDDYNLVLSNQRAQSIKDVFSANEFDENLISNVDGKGEILLKIVTETDIHKIRGLNRKAEIIVYPYDPPRELPEKKPENAKERLSGDLKVGDKILIDNLHFRLGYDYLMDYSVVVLDEIAEILVEREDLIFSIEGHVCCTHGERDAVNKRTKKRNLSMARAQKVYNYLKDRGVDPRRMKAVGQRHKYPLGGDPALDRRVEIRITEIVKAN
jgi:outer membrane protein OmpA-like peptidoglycan-associated protein